jgi:hypothetical protein
MRGVLGAELLDAACFSSTMKIYHNKPEANKARLDNRWGCAVGHAFRNFNPPSRFDAHPRPSGASA